MHYQYCSSDFVPVIKKTSVRLPWNFCTTKLSEFQENFLTTKIWWSTTFRGTVPKTYTADETNIRTHAVYHIRNRLFVFKDLHTCTHVFLKNDTANTARRPLEAIQKSSSCNEKNLGMRFCSGSWWKKIQCLGELIKTSVFHRKARSIFVKQTYHSAIIAGIIFNEKDSFYSKNLSECNAI